MKVYKTSITPLFSILLLACVVSLTTSCTKSSSSKSPSDSWFSFNYNGSQYTLPHKEGPAEWGFDNSGVFINRPDLFNGIIHFPSANCQLTASGSGFGFPIDSVKVYIYQSGSVNSTYTNCRRKTGYDFSTGSTYSYDVCDAYGTFDLVLKNKENKTLSITNGKFERYSFAR